MLIIHSIQKTSVVGATISLFFLFTISAYAQKGNVKGKVLKERDNTPLYKATVKISGIDKTTHTDKDGNYNFDSLEADKDYKLEMSKSPLYEDEQTTVNVKTNTTTEASDVALARRPPNVNRIRQLINLLDRRKFDEFEKALNVLSEQCEEEDDEYCRTIKDIDEQFDRRNLRAVREKLEGLSTKLEKRPVPR
jgi:hypothetical protein